MLGLCIYLKPFVAPRLNCAVSHVRICLLPVRVGLRLYTHVGACFSAGYRKVWQIPYRESFKEQNCYVAKQNLLLFRVILKPIDTTQPILQVRTVFFLSYSFKFTRFAKFCKLFVFSLCIFYSLEPCKVWIFLKRILTNSLIQYFWQRAFSYQIWFVVSNLAVRAWVAGFFFLLKGNQVPVSHACL